MFDFAVKRATRAARQRPPAYPSRMALLSRIRGLRVPGRPSWHVTDAALTLVVTLFVCVWTLVAMRYESEPAHLTLVGWALILIGCGALWFRRRWPVGVAVVTLLASAAYYPLSVFDGPLMVTFALALYTTSAQGRLAAAVALAAVTLLAVGFGESRQSGGMRQLDDVSVVMLAGWLISLIAVGRAEHTRGAYLREVEQRALAAEREQRARALQSATEERLRIARELHDVLGHSISLINVQSSAVLHKLGKGPEPAVALAAAEEALTAVKAASKDALRELRATLGVLRQADEVAPTSPAPGLDRLDELTGRARSTGLSVSTRVEGVRRGLPPQLDLAAYRIVQESLTNVTRHARACTVLITLTYDDEHLCVRIEDDGGGAPDTPDTQDTRDIGNGIRGMTERARAFGGELTAHHTAAGFRVEARLPLEEHA
jgi:signal transduction histidine kinase